MDRTTRSAPFRGFVDFRAKNRARARTRATVDPELPTVMMDSTEEDRITFSPCTLTVGSERGIWGEALPRWERVWEFVMNVSEHDRKRVQFLDKLLCNGFTFQVDGGSYRLNGQLAGSPRKRSTDPLFTCYEYEARIDEFPSQNLTVRIFLTKETGRLALRAGDVVIPFPQAVSQSITEEQRKKIAESACAEAVRLELATQKAAKASEKDAPNPSAQTTSGT